MGRHPRCGLQTTGDHSTSAQGAGLSHTLFTLYNICMTKKKVYKLFLMSKILHLQDRFSKFQATGMQAAVLVCVFVKPVGAVVILVTVRAWCQCLHMRLQTCLCIHNLPQSVSYFNTTECSSYTQRGGERSLNSLSWSNGTTLDYNCQK